MITKSKQVCPRCGRRVETMEVPNVAPWFVRHGLGRAADLAGGETRRTQCPASNLSIGDCALRWSDEEAPHGIHDRAWMRAEAAAEKAGV